MLLVAAPCGALAAAAAALAAAAAMAAPVGPRPAPGGPAAGAGRALDFGGQDGAQSPVGDALSQEVLQLRQGFATLRFRGSPRSSSRKRRKRKRNKDKKKRKRSHSSSPPGSRSSSPSGKSEIRAAKGEGGSWERAGVLSLLPAPCAANVSLADGAFLH